MKSYLDSGSDVSIINNNIKITTTSAKKLKAKWEINIKYDNLKLP